MKREEKPNPVEDYRNIQLEVREWEKYLNDNIGYFAFTFAIASLGTNQPQFWAFISIIFLTTVHQTKKKGKMGILERIEKKNKNQKTDYDIFIEREIRKSISVLRALPFTIGYITLVIIILAPTLLPFKSGVTFLYGEKPYFDFKTLSIVKPSTD